MATPTDSQLFEDIYDIAKAMFNKNFFGIFHGSLSVKINNNRFCINKRNAIFSHLDAESLIYVYDKEDYRWNEASIDTPIHLSIYQNFSDAKCIAYCLPPYTVAYSLNRDIIIPRDYFGSRLLKEISVYDPRDFESWYERAEVEIYRFFKEQKNRIMVIRGYGVYLYARDLAQLAKNIAVLENSCRILHLSASEQKTTTNTPLLLEIDGDDQWIL
ncbi:hypothetical protein CCZ01_03750 [Helicobacter monodelphidis]|uniref:class II aldolase and adducin N-terminal domain-containing protein n=1 Tax=Helicobacter sp. 15-1451 TaxID=2004995 RepID=UPI000DCD0121|nr:class II aldolase and adducin N-terminal domain-containing protein [Helicobacter sp. 15-1451]RAX58198.1 hypothetical protein CCZ01_03750 [Helicobacter sp. 15-1451]